MMIRGLITVIFCCSIFHSFGQETFLGKRFGISIGTSLSFPIAPKRFLKASGDPVRYYGEYAIFPPKVDMDLQMAINSRLNIVLNTEFRGIQHTRFEFKGSVYDSGIGSYAYHDVFRIRTNVLSNSLAIRLHSEYAPVGPYLQLGVGHSLAFSKIYPTLSESLESSSFNDEIEYSDTTRLLPWTQRSSYVLASVSVGNTFFISDRFALDFGAKTTFFFGSTRISHDYNPSEDNTTLDFKTEFESIVKDITKRNLSSSYLLEFYIKLSLF